MKILASNFIAIRAEYVAGSASCKQLARKHKVSENALEKRAAKEKWAEARRKMAEEVSHSADTAIAGAKINELVAFNQTDLQVAKALRAQVAKHIQASQSQINPKPLSVDAIATLARAAEAAQRIGRLALGASTDNSSIVSRAVLSIVFESAPEV